MKNLLKCFLGLMLFGALAPACISDAPTEDSTSAVESDSTVIVPDALVLPNPHPRPLKCGCQSTLDCAILCGANLICQPAPGGGEGVCVTAQAAQGGTSQ